MSYSRWIDSRWYIFWCATDTWKIDPILAIWDSKTDAHLYVNYDEAAELHYALLQWIADVDLERGPT